MRMIYYTKVVVEFETSGEDFTREFVWEEKENLDEFMERVKEGIRRETDSLE